MMRTGLYLYGLVMLGCALGMVASCGTREEQGRGDREQMRDTQPADSDKGGEAPEKKKGGLDKIRGIFGF